MEPQSRGRTMSRANSIAGGSVRGASPMGPRGMEPALRREQMEREPNWKEIITNYWPQYLVVALIGVAVDYVDGIEPYQWAIYTGSDAEYYRYSYAHMHETVPDWMVPVVALGIPIGIFLLSYLTGRTSRVELHHACLMLVACVLTTGMLTNAIKVQVGCPRPDFMSRCWPSGGPPMVTRKGLPKCEPGVDHAELVKGQRSFPSGHTSWSAAGLGYLTFWLMGTLRCFCGNAEPARLFFSLMPQMGVVWMGMNRVRHHKHHAEDVLASFVLGTFLAWAFYRKVFASVRSINAGRLSADVYEDDKADGLGFTLAGEVAAPPHPWEGYGALGGGSDSGHPALLGPDDRA